jgi:1,4-alpha-glucan branching enzyme
LVEQLTLNQWVVGSNPSASTIQRAPGATTPAIIFAIESSYGGAAAFKNFIQSCHTNGIAVLLDIVHNHYGPSDIATWQFDQRLPAIDGGIYFYSDRRARRPPSGAPGPISASPEVRAFIVDSMKMFLTEYRLDGFRWDSVHNIRYTSGRGQRSNADGDRVLAEANDWMRKNHPDALRIAEDHAFDGGGVGFEAQWNSAFQVHLLRLRARRAMTSATSRSFAVELSRLDNFNWVNFAECHDSPATSTSTIACRPTSIPPRPTACARARLSLLAGGIALTVPGFPMLLQGFEMHDVDDFSDNTPIPWARAQRHPQAGIVRANADLIHLRREHSRASPPDSRARNSSVTHLDNEAKVMAYARAAAKRPPRPRYGRGAEPLRTRPSKN